MASQSTTTESAFRKHVPDLSLPRFTMMKKQTPYEYAKEFIEGGQPPWLHGLFLHWRRLLKEPFKGISNDGMHSPTLRWLSLSIMLRQELTFC